VAVKQVLVDTNAYAAFKRGDPEAVDILRQAQAIGLSAIVLGELLSGFSAGRRDAENRRELGAFLDSPRVRVLPVDFETADFYARIYANLRRRGKPIPTNDLWIAASALQHGAAIFTYDQHFSMVEGVVVINRVADLLP